MAGVNRCRVPAGDPGISVALTRGSRCVAVRLSTPCSGFLFRWTVEFRVDFFFGECLGMAGAERLVLLCVAFLDRPTYSELGTRFGLGRWFTTTTPQGRQDLSVNLSENSRIFGCVFFFLFPFFIYLGSPAFRHRAQANSRCRVDHRRGPS